mmetsp:Transcript_58859/g.116594  ORF Transcript_58859/g.116594 Transcript_58859/m.116594 type:complete len:227 (-) Transcript_58859:867-1547(-)
MCAVHCNLCLRSNRSLCWGAFVHQTWAQPHPLELSMVSCNLALNGAFHSSIGRMNFQQRLTGFSASCMMGQGMQSQNGSCSLLSSSLSGGTATQSVNKILHRHLTWMTSNGLSLAATLRTRVAFKVQMPSLPLAILLISQHLLKIRHVCVSIPLLTPQSVRHGAFHFRHQASSPTFRKQHSPHPLARHHLNLPSRLRSQHFRLQEHPLHLLSKHHLPRYLQVRLCL